MQGMSDTTRSNHQKLANNEKFQETVIETLHEIKSDMKKYIFHVNMQSVDISDFFPLKSGEDLEKFMDKSDEQWMDRRNGFYHLLHTTIADTKRKFSSSLLHVLFTRDFIKNHRWPG